MIVATFSSCFLLLLRLLLLLWCWCSHLLMLLLLLQCHKPTSKARNQQPDIFFESSCCCCSCCSCCIAAASAAAAALVVVMLVLASADAAAAPAVPETNLQGKKPTASHFFRNPLETAKHHRISCRKCRVVVVAVVVVVAGGGKLLSYSLARSPLRSRGRRIPLVVQWDIEPSCCSCCCCCSSSRSWKRTLPDRETQWPWRTERRQNRAQKLPNVPSETLEKQ